MWGHYGDAHKGICIGYDFSRAGGRVKSHLYPVQYSDTRFSNLNAQNIASHTFLYLRKSKEWEYEREFRLIYRGYSLKNNIKLNCISEITLGLRANQQMIEIFRSLVGDRNIKLYRTKQEENSFKLVREEICLNRPLRDELR